MTFNAKKIFEIHEELLITNKMEPGCINKGTLDSIYEKAMLEFDGQEVYPTPTNKAAVLLEGIIRLHPFVDGNKRTALTVAQEFLFEHNMIFLLPITGLRFAVTIANNHKMENGEIEKLIYNIDKFIISRTAKVKKRRALKKIMKMDIQMLEKIKVIAKSRPRLDFAQSVIDYWVAKDIYLDANITVEELLFFLKQRIKKVVEFLDGYQKL